MSYGTNMEQLVAFSTTVWTEKKLQEVDTIRRFEGKRGKEHVSVRGTTQRPRPHDRLLITQGTAQFLSSYCG